MTASKQWQTLECLQTLSGSDVPDLDSGISVARHEDVVSELHSAGQRLVTNQRVQASPGLSAPDTDWCIQRPTHNVHPIKLLSTPMHQIHNSNRWHFNSLHHTECCNCTASPKLCSSKLRQISNNFDDFGTKTKKKIKLRFQHDLIHVNTLPC